MATRRGKKKTAVKRNENVHQAWHSLGAANASASFD
jgi:hypothetical protein